LFFVHRPTFFFLAKDYDLTTELREHLRHPYRTTGVRKSANATTTEGSAARIIAKPGRGPLAPETGINTHIDAAVKIAIDTINKKRRTNMRLGFISASNIIFLYMLGTNSEGPILNKESLSDSVFKDDMHVAIALEND
jgi:hypothetical protein